PLDSCSLSHSTSGRQSLPPFPTRRSSDLDPRVEAYGSVDETNATIGLARSFEPAAEIDAVLERVQNELFVLGAELACVPGKESRDRKSTRLNSSHVKNSYAVFCLKKKTEI